MKHTKRLLSLILAMALCFAMTACTSAEDKVFEEADALLAAGDYEGAIAAFSSIGRYQEISDKIAEAMMLQQKAERLANIANAERFFGTWVNIKTDFVDFITLTLNSDGTSALAWGADTYNSTFDCVNNTISIYNPNFTFAVQQFDGITHLVSSEMGLDLVPEANYSAFELQDHEITIDNWQDYFEIKEVNSISVNQFGEVSSVMPSIGIFLKEEYYSRLPDNYWDLEISFELVYDEAAYKVLNCAPDDYEYEFGGKYEVEPATAPRWWELETGCTYIGTVNDQRNYTHLSEQSPFYNTVSAEIGMYGSSLNDGKAIYVTRWTNVQVSRVIGTLKLFPE